MGGWRFIGGRSVLALAFELALAVLDDAQPGHAGHAVDAVARAELAGMRVNGVPRPLIAKN